MKSNNSFVPVSRGSNSYSNTVSQPIRQQSRGGKALEALKSLQQDQQQSNQQSSHSNKRQLHRSISLPSKLLKNEIDLAIGINELVHMDNNSKFISSGDNQDNSNLDYICIDDLDQASSRPASSAPIISYIKRPSNFSDALNSKSNNSSNNSNSNSNSNNNSSSSNSNRLNIDSTNNAIDGDKNLSPNSSFSSRSSYSNQDNNDKNMPSKDLNSYNTTQHSSMSIQNNRPFSNFNSSSSSSSTLSIHNKNKNNNNNNNNNNSRDIKTNVGSNIKRSNSPFISIDNSSNNNNKIINSNSNIINSSIVTHRSDQSINASDQPVESICFRIFEGKVTSLIITPDGLYIIAAFSKGSVRLYDLSVNGNADPEDRFGCLIASIEGTNSTIHLELGGDGRTYSHLFVCNRSGSNKMIVVDMRSLRELKKKRGFITMAGGDVKIFTKDNSKLRGFTALTTLSCSNGKKNGEYSAKYRLICGKGNLSYNIWEVSFEATDDNGCLKYTQDWQNIYSCNIGTPSLMFACFLNPKIKDISGINSNISNCNSSSSSSSTSLFNQTVGKSIKNSNNNKDINKYPLTSSYTILEPTSPLQVSNLGFNKDNFTIMASHELSIAETIIDEQSNMAYPSIMQPYNLSNIDSNFSMDNSNFNQQLSSNKNSTNNKKENCEFLIYQHEKEVKIFRLPINDKKDKKDKDVLKGCFHLHANSSDGMTLFTGLDELNVNHYSNDNSLLSSETFSLLSSDEIKLNANQRSRTRHLRQIDSITCTADACYALIICSDNTVLLYSMCDIFERGNRPISGNIGIITLLFQAIDSYKIEVCISNICEDGKISSSNSQTYLCECNSNGNDSSMNNMNQSNNFNMHNTPHLVICAISWWQISNPGENAVLRKTRLVNQAEIRKKNQKSNEFTYNIVPIAISIPGVGLYNSNNGNNKNIRSASSSSLTCWLCGEFNTVHWDSTACKDRMIHNDNISNNSNDVDSSDNEDEDSDEKEIKPDLTHQKKDRGNNKILKQNNNSINEISKKISVTSKKIPVQMKLWADDEEENERNEHSKKNQLNSELINKKDSDTKSNVTSMPLAPSIPVAPSSVDKQNKLIQLKLEEQLRLLRTEISLVIRKADRRFEEEKRLRKVWNNEKNSLLNEIEKLKQDFVRSEEICQDKVRDRDQLMALLNNCPLKEIMSILDNNNNNYNNNNKINENDRTAPFCVICQDYTATILLLPCAHLCLCEHHAQQMIENGQLKTCPACRRECRSTCKVNL